MRDVTVANLTAENTGDDSLALFNVVQDAKISDCHIRCRVVMIFIQLNVITYDRDSFARGILLNNSPTTELMGNILVRCHILYIRTFLEFLLDLLWTH